MTVVTSAAAAAQSRLVGVEEFARLPDDGVPRELVNGVVRTMAPAGGLHGELGNNLSYEVTAHVRRNRLGAVFTAETGFRLRRDPDTVRAPDVAFVRAERLAAARVPGFPELAPDLVAEVVSPHDRAVDVNEKALAWVDAGVRLVWVVDGANRSVTVHSGSATVLLRENDSLNGADVLPGFSLRVSDLWV